MIIDRCKLVVSSLLIMICIMTQIGLAANIETIEECNESAYSKGIEESCVLLGIDTDTPTMINCSQFECDGLLVSNDKVLLNGEDIYCNSDSSTYYPYNFIMNIFERASSYNVSGNAFGLNDYQVTINDFSLESIDCSGYNLSLGEIVGANEDVHLSGCNIANKTGNDYACIFSSNGNVKIDADNISTSGVIYVPNGELIVNACDFEFTGVIIAKNIIINAEKVSVNSKHEIIKRYNIKFYDLENCSDFNENLLDAWGSSSSGSGSSSGSSQYYYNSGTTCCTKVDYSKYNLTSVVQKGDIIYDSEGGSGVTGHVAYVYGIYYMPEPGNYTKPKMYYNIRVIEAISEGVKYGLLDDKRCDDRGTKLLRYNKITSTIESKVSYFIYKQLNKSYKLDFARDTSINETDWYCSELVWAGFKYAGIDIETTGTLNEPGITPRDIKQCDKIKEIDYK